MSQTFIAAYDGSAPSRAAVQLAVALAAAQDADVLAAHVYPRLAPVGLRGRVFDKEIQQDLHDKGREVIDGLDVEGVARRVLLAGSPAQALHDLAEEEQATLIVVGATHYSHVGRMTPGSVASNLLHGAPCPVLVAPSDHEPRPIRTIAVAYDDGIQAKAALAHAVQLARTLDARLEIIAGAEHELFAGPAMVAAADLEELMRDDVAQPRQGRSRRHHRHPGGHPRRHGADPERARRCRGGRRPPGDRLARLRAAAQRPRRRRLALPRRQRAVPGPRRPARRRGRRGPRAEPTHVGPAAA